MQDDAIGSSWSAERGDGDVEIAGEGSPLYQLPHNIQDPLNIWAGIPLWLLGRQPGGQLQALGCGLLYPLLNSAELDFFHPQTAHHIARSYFCDPRIESCGDDEQQEALVTERANQELRRLRVMGARLVDFYAVPDRPEWRD